MTDETEGVSLTMRDVQRLDRMLTWYERRTQASGDSRQKNVPPQAIWYWAKIAESAVLSAGTYEDPTTFVFDVWEPDPEHDDPDDVDNPPPLILTDDDDLKGLKGANYTSAVGDSGTRIKVEFAHGRWVLKTADC